MHNRSYTCFFILVVFPACVATTYNYMQMIRLSLSDEAMPDAHMQVESRRHVRAISVMLFGVAVFLLPFSIYLVYGSFNEELYDPVTMNYLVYLTSANGVVTPWFYTYRNNDIQNVFRRMFCGNLDEPSREQNTFKNASPSNFSRHETVHSSQGDSMSLQDEVFAHDINLYRRAKRSSGSSIVSRPQRISGGSIMTNSGKVLTVPSLVLEDIEGVPTCDIPIDVPVEDEEQNIELEEDVMVDDIVSSTSIEIPLSDSSFWVTDWWHLFIGLLFWRLLVQ